MQEKTLVFRSARKPQRQGPQTSLLLGSLSQRDSNPESGRPQSGQGLKTFKRPRDRGPSDLESNVEDLKFDASGPNPGGSMTDDRPGGAPSHLTLEAALARDRARAIAILEGADSDLQQDEERRLLTFPSLRSAGSHPLLCPTGPGLRALRTHVSRWKPSPEVGRALAVLKAAQEAVRGEAKEEKLRASAAKQATREAWRRARDESLLTRATTTRHFDLYDEGDNPAEEGQASIPNHVHPEDRDDASGSEGDGDDVITDP